MGRPTPRSGGMFKTEKIKIEDVAPNDAQLKLCRAWDLASTDADGDFTAGAKLGVDNDGVYWILDMQRGQWATDDRDKRIVQTAELDGKNVQIRGPQDPGAAGKDMALHFSRKLAGYRVKTLPVSGEKVVRWDPFSSQVNAGNVRMLRGPWNRKLLEEMEPAPLGANDDQLDALADAFSELTTKKKFMVA